MRGGKNEMMKAVILVPILLEEKNRWDASLVLFLMATSLPSYCTRLMRL